MSDAPDGPDSAAGSDALSPFAEWAALRDELGPLIGERAVSFLAYSILDEADAFEGAAYFREALAASGNDVDVPQVTENERLLIDWGRQVTGNDVAADMSERFARAFSASTRDVLIRFTALTIATAITETFGS